MGKRFGLAALAVLLLSACGGDLSLEEYFRQAADIRRDHREASDRRGDTFEAQIGALGTRDEEFARLTRSYVAETVPAFQETLTALQGLDPPGAVEEAHSAFMAAARSYRELLDAVESGLETTATADEVTAVINGSGLAAARIRVGAACRRLEMVAAGNGLTVDLSCG